MQINDCSGVAVRQSSTQNLNLTIDHLTVYRCAVGVHVTGGVKGSAWNFALNGVVYVPLRDDNAQLVNVQIKVHGYHRSSLDAWPSS